MSALSKKWLSEEKIFNINAFMKIKALWIIVSIFYVQLGRTIGKRRPKVTHFQALKICNQEDK